AQAGQLDRLRVEIGVGPLLGIVGVALAGDEPETQFHYDERGTSFHGTSLSVRTSPGRPSTRSPRMLRMTSDVPPSIELARERRNRWRASPWASVARSGRRSS